MTGRLNATPAPRGKTISISEAARIIATVINTHTEFTAEGEADLIDEAAMFQIAAAQGQRGSRCSEPGTLTCPPSAGTHVRKSRG